MMTPTGPGPQSAAELFEAVRRQPWRFGYYRARAYLCLFYFALFFGVSYPFFRWCMANPRRYAYAMRWRRVWARSIALLFGIQIRVEGAIPMDSPRLLIVANHFSYLDIPVLVAAFPLDLHFIAKSELLRIPFFRHFFRTMDIAIPRGSAQGSVKAYQRAEAFWKPGSAVVVFPEGGILGQAPAMIPFRVSPFAMALQQGATVLPVSLPDTWKILPECPLHFLRPGLCRVRVLEPQEISDRYPDERSLRNRCFEVIAQDLAKTAPIQPPMPHEG